MNLSLYCCWRCRPPRRSSSPLHFGSPGYRCPETAPGLGTAPSESFRSLIDKLIGTNERAAWWCARNAICEFFDWESIFWGQRFMTGALIKGNLWFVLNCVRKRWFISVWGSEIGFLAGAPEFFSGFGFMYSLWNSSPRKYFFKLSISKATANFSETNAVQQIALHIETFKSNTKYRFQNLCAVMSIFESWSSQFAYSGMRSYLPLPTRTKQTKQFSHSSVFWARIHISLLMFLFWSSYLRRFI